MVTESVTPPGATSRVALPASSAVLSNPLPPPSCTLIQACGTGFLLLASMTVTSNRERSGGTGGPVDSTLVYTLYLYNEAFHYFRMGYASALAWVLLLIIGCFTAVSFLTSKYWVHYDD